SKTKVQRPKLFKGGQTETTSQHLIREMHLRKKRFMILGVWLAAGILPAELFPQKPSKPNSILLERGRATKISPPPQRPAELKLVSYNIRWRSGDELRVMIELLKHDQEIGGAQVIGLQ